MSTEKTITDRTVDSDILEYTVGDDPVLDLDLAVWDAMGTAAHVTMLSEMKLARPVVTKKEAALVRKELKAVAEKALAGKFRIETDDQDVHRCDDRDILLFFISNIFQFQLLILNVFSPD